MNSKGALWVDIILQFDSNLVESAFPSPYHNFATHSHPPKHSVHLINGFFDINLYE